MKRIHWILILALLSVWLRYTGLRWGSGLLTHPDETRIAMGVGDIFTNRGNPKFSAYGHLPLYLQAAVFKLRVFLNWLTPDHFQEMVISGRMVAATLSLGTIFLAGRIAHLLGFPFWAAWIAAFCTALFPLSVQLSQYSTVDAHVTFFATLAIERAMVFRQGKRTRDLIGTLFALGAATACKASAFPLIFIVWFFLGLPWKSFRFWLVPILALGCFVIFQPYAVLDWKGFIRDVSEQGRWVRGQGPPVFFRQYEDSLKFVFSFRDLFFYSIGPVAMVLAAIGFSFSLKNRRWWLLTAWFGFNFFLLGTSYAKFSRYWMPTIPLFALYAAWGLVEIRNRTSPKFWQTILALFVFHATLLGIAVHTVHFEKHPNRQAAEFLDRTAHPRGPTQILFDSVWVGFPPVGDRVAGHPVSGNFAELFEDHREPEFAQIIAQKLSRSSYFITTNHLAIRTAYEQSDQRWIQAQTFEAMRENRLGFQLVQVVTARPSILPDLVDDFFLDYSIPIYDHPTIFIWQRIVPLSPDEIRREILNTKIDSPKLSLAAFGCLARGEADCSTAALQKPKASVESSKLPVEDPFRILAPRWWHPLAWYLFFFLTGLAGWPWMMRLLPGSLAAGYAVSRVLVWVVWGYALWLLGHLPGEWLTPFVVRATWVGLLAAGGWQWARKGFLKEIRVASALRTGIHIEITLFFVYALFLLFRFYAPDIHFSENPVDLSYLSITTKTLTMPPIDPGYSGTFLNYYYYGFYLLALPAKIFSMAPNVSYVLSFAVIPALISGLILTLGASFIDHPKKFWFGVASILLVIGVGNWDGLVQLIERKPAFDFFRSAHEVIEHTVHEFPLWTFLFVDLHAHLISGILFVLFMVWLRFSNLTQLTAPQTLVGAVLLGSMGPSNTWDYFTCNILLILMTLLIYRDRRKIESVVPVARLLALAYLLFSPFYLIFTKKLAELGVGIVGNQMTDLHAAIICMGLFLTFVSADAYRIFKEAWQANKMRVLWISMAVVFFVTYTLAILFHRVPLTYLLYSLLGLGVFSMVMTRRFSFPHVEPNLLVAYALLIMSMCEIFFIKDWLQGGEWKRMNTIFKFYFQCYFLLAAVAPFLMWRVLKNCKSTTVRTAWIGIFGAAIFAAAIWTPNGIRARSVFHVFQRQGRFEKTLDGLSWVKHLRPHEYEAIAWLWRNGTAKDVMLEAGKGDYMYEYNVVSSASGVPTVQSWWSHTDQRDRVADLRIPLVKEFYTTPDVERALQIARRFHVTYVYVAEREKEEYGVEGLTKFTKNPEAFEVVLDRPLGKLYRVRL
jgi:YYY domain-containing protein